MGPGFLAGMPPNSESLSGQASSRTSSQGSSAGLCRRREVRGLSLKNDNPEKNSYMRRLISTTSLLIIICLFGLLCLVEPGFGADLTQNTSEAGGQSWTNVFWRTNGVGTQVGPPVPGNTYQMVPNTIPFGNNLGNSRIRNPIANSSLLETFPGDSLTLNTNTEIR